MPETLNASAVLVVLLMLGILGSILGAWIWVILRLALQLPVLPAFTPRIVPWGAPSVLVAILVWFGVINLASIGYSVLHPEKVAQAKAAGGHMPPGDAMTLSATYNAATLVLVPLALAATAGARRRDLGLVGRGLIERIGLGVISYPLLAPCVFGAMFLSLAIWGKTPHPLEDAIQQNRSPQVAALMILAGAVLAPMAEELIFRGVLLGWLTKVALGHGSARSRRLAPDRFVISDTDAEGSPDPGEDANPYVPPLASISRADELLDYEHADKVEPGGRILPLLMANAIVSIVFAALHGAVWPTPVPIFFLSMGLGFLYQRTGGIVAPIALHMIFNGISTLMMFLAVGANLPKPPKVIEPANAEMVVEASSPIGDRKIAKTGNDPVDRSAADW